MEAWTVAVLVVVAATGFVFLELYWPLYLLIGAAGAYALGRRLTWKDE